MTVLADADTDQVDSASEATSDSKKTVSKLATLQYMDTLSARAETWHGQRRDSRLKEKQTEQKNTKTYTSARLLNESNTVHMISLSLSLSLCLSVCLYLCVILVK